MDPALSQAHSSAIAKKKRHCRNEPGRLTGLKGRHRIAQGIALGGVTAPRITGLKGRNRIACCATPSGWVGGAGHPVPRASPS